MHRQVHKVRRRDILYRQVRQLRGIENRQVQEVIGGIDTQAGSLGER
jgi:hypothetical protein